MPLVLNTAPSARLLALTGILSLLFSVVRGADPETHHASPGAASPATPAEIYGQGIRSTSWKSPMEERAGFHLPPQFEVRLFASEPDIAKPLNLAFDDRGRMWVTHSVEYPYPASDPSAARDAVSILEDTDGDGSADQITKFAEGLNVPMGVLPYGEGCLCFSIPNLWYLRDTDGDGKCDRRDIVLGPFDTTRDTHGMINALRDGGDGWIYACHGFNNQSQVSGTDGHVVTMHSGNTFRFRPDGSRVEHVSHGQVNPFGMTDDEWGYRYTADCHSKPITQIIRGACYPSFGRPHDGLGFLPPMVEHLHGSTAISGILFLPPSHPIEPLRNQFISGNVMTSRLNRNLRSFQGATAKGIELSDFMTSDDPWFRPVDIRLGPDGHLYVADFYNKIIGHYEVRLDHPGRDRTSGRIWQIRYLDPKRSTAATDKAPGSDVKIAIGGSSLAEQVSALQRLVKANRLTDEVVRALLEAAEPQLRVAVLRYAGENQERLSIDLVELAIESLDHANPHVQQSAAEWIGIRGAPRHIPRLRQELAEVDPKDPVLRQTLRIAIRELLRRSGPDVTVWDQVPDAQLASILLGLPTARSAAAILQFLQSKPDAANRTALMAHAAKYAAPQQLSKCVDVAIETTAGDRDSAWQLLDVICQAQNARPGHVPDPIRRWALQRLETELLEVELSDIDSSDPIVGWFTPNGSPWPQETRRIKAGGNAALASSLGRGEKYRGRLVSDSFPAPDQITFWVAGHNGHPDLEDRGKNFVRLVRTSDDETLRLAHPPREDTAKQVHWDTSEFAGHPVRIECVDGDAGSAYAWIAIGRFTPPWLRIRGPGLLLTDSLRWIRRLGLSEQSHRLHDWLDDSNVPSRIRVEIARTLAVTQQQPGVGVVLDFLLRSEAPTELVELAIDSVRTHKPLREDEILKPLCKRLSSSQQQQFAIAWANGGGSMSTLVDIVAKGWISPAVFADPATSQTIAPRLSAGLASRVAELTSGIDLSQQQRERLIALQRSVQSHDIDLRRGHALFTKHCAACHQLRGEGLVVGPQLDGAATRSVARLLEDVVTPDRNVDEAFRTTSFLLDDGRVVVGLVTSENETDIRITLPDGKAVTIDVSSVEVRKDAGRSLMPSNVSETLSAADLADLIGFVRGG